MPHERNEGMDNETYTETRQLLVQAKSVVEALAKRESNYTSEDALTFKFIHLMLTIMLAAWRERYKDTI